jgi:hypothetical protein
VGRLWVNTQTGAWRLAVHGLPRPPRGAHYVLTASTRDGGDLALGRIERWEEGVALLAGRADFDLITLERLSLELVSPDQRVRLLEAANGAW